MRCADQRVTIERVAEELELVRVERLRADVGHHLERVDQLQLQLLILDPVPNREDADVHCLGLP